MNTERNPHIKRTLDTLEQLHKRLDEVEGEDIPEGFLTAAQFAEQNGCSVSHANSILNRAVAAGIFERKRFFDGGRKKYFYREAEE